MRVAMTVISLNALARLLNGISGRKRLIWITGSRPITVRSDAGTGEAPELTREYGPKLQDAATRLAYAGVSVHSLDARGLTVVGTDASVSGSDASDDLYRDRSEEAIRSSQATLREMSDETGGVAHVNGNDLTSAVREALRPTAGFYRLTYQPANKNSDGQFRKIEVQVANFKNSQLQYRHGYKAEAEAGNNTEELQRRFLAALSTGHPHP